MDGPDIDPLRKQHTVAERRLERRLSRASAAPCKHTPGRSNCEDDMWRLVLISAILGVSSFGYAGQALAQSAPDALVILDGTAAGAPAAVIPAAPAPQRVISVREGPTLSVIVLPPDVAGSDPSLV